jgi:hypothetical protein
MKIFQAYYQDNQQQELLPNLIPLDTRTFDCRRFEFDIFKHLRPHGDFGVVSWKFKRKTNLKFWEEEVRDRLKTWDAVIINPFPGIEAMSYNCWQSHPTLVPAVNSVVDCDVFMDNMAFCSFIFAKKNWWDYYFDFIESRLNVLLLDQSANYVRNSSYTMEPFVIERLLNYCTQGAYMWQYPREHYIEKFGDDSLYKLKQLKKDQAAWEKIAISYRKDPSKFWKIAALDDRG